MLLPLKVPVGTVVKNQDTDEIIADLEYAGSSFVLATGGCGGLGNANFKSSTNQRTLESTPGEKGEEIFVELEMKSIADVGLVIINNFCFYSNYSLELSYLRCSLLLFLSSFILSETASITPFHRCNNTL